MNRHKEHTMKCPTVPEVTARPKQVFALKGGAHGIAALLADKPDLVDEISSTLGRPQAARRARAPAC